jgi:hypothetical protein
MMADLVRVAEGAFEMLCGENAATVGGFGSDELSLLLEPLSDIFDEAGAMYSDQGVSKNRI